MTEIPSPWQVTVYALIAHPSNTAVLMLPSDAGYALPSFTQEQESQWLQQQRALDALQTMTGTDLFLLRYVLNGTVEADRRVDALMEFELLSTVETAHETWIQGEWIDATALTQIPLAQPEFRAQIEAFLAEKAHGSIPSVRAPWARTGWYVSMREWVDAQLTALGHAPIQRIEIVRTWALSCVLRVITTASELFYFKATAAIPLFGNEGLVTTELARHFPEMVERPLAVDAPRRWMLMSPFAGDADFSATPISDVVALDRRLNLMRAYADLQVKSSRLANALLTAGLLDRRLQWTSDQIDLIFADEEFLNLNDDELARLRALAPMLKERCHRIADFDVPAALVHGDLHTGNVAFRADGLTLFDWTDACIAHPFVDMLDIFWEKDEAIRHQLLNVYLAAWTVFAPTDSLHELWQQIQPVLALHHLISYHSIAHHIEPTQRQDLAEMVTYFARKILEMDD
ncbi:phosphotransferase [bacterium]|nr:phosphotransferase [bacterium]